MKNYRNVLITLFFVLGFTLRLIYILRFTPSDINIPTGDASGYHTLAMNLIKYGQFAYEFNNPTAHREPLYPIFLALIYKFFGENLLIVRIMQCFINLFSIYLIYLLSKKIFTENVAVFAVGISSIWPSFIYYTGTVLREIFFTFLLLIVMYLLYQNLQKTSILKQIFLGLIASLVALTNSIGVVIFVGIVIYFLLLKKISFKNLFVVCLSFLFIYSFWVIRNYKVLHGFVLGSTNGGKTFWDGTDIIPFEVRGLPEEVEFLRKTEDYLVGMNMKNEIEKDRFFYKKAIEYYKRNPSKILILSIKKFLKFWKVFPHKGRIYGANEKIIRLVSLVYIFIFLLFLLGVYFLFKENLFNSSTFLLFLPIILFCIIYSIFWSQIRYRVPIEPYVIIVASYGLKKIVYKLKNI